MFSKDMVIRDIYIYIYVCVLADCTWTSKFHTTNGKGAAAETVQDVSSARDDSRLSASRLSTSQIVPGIARELKTMVNYYRLTTKLTNRYGGHDQSVAIEQRRWLCGHITAEILEQKLFFPGQLVLVSPSHFDSGFASGRTEPNIYENVS